ncbi:MAG: T9SS type A sorting domain-containing protein [Bacteroidales bacterium]|nr:T9SS type A sorting domain-containing protein [Bacteroidales bacterium]
MKINTTILMMVVFTISFITLNSNRAVAYIQSEEDSVIMGSNYANDVYYNLESGEVGTANRTNWDVAFSTQQMSVSILTNGGAGTALYTYPKDDTAGWNSVDTTGLHEWKAQYNSKEEWAIGAFNRNALGHPDYGWGMYNINTHNVTGDSLFIIQLSNGSYMKMWMEMKNSIANTYHFRYAALDGSNEQNVEVNANNFTGNYAYYSLQNQETVDREPEENWHLLFTKYAAAINMGAEVVHYPVTGVLVNAGVEVAEVTGVEQESYNDWGAHAFATAIAEIGYDWKEFNDNTFQYEVLDSLVYFVKDTLGNVHKLYFTGFESGTSGNGKVVFNLETISATGTEELEADEMLNLYPNPANNQVNLQLSTEDATISVFDVTGRMVYQTKGDNHVKINTNDWQSGLYILKIDNEQRTITRKLIIDK